MFDKTLTPPPPCYLWSWVAFEEPGFSGDMYVLEKGLYGTPEDWGAQSTQILSIQPVVQVNIMHVLMITSKKRQNTSVSVKHKFLYNNFSNKGAWKLHLLYLIIVAWNDHIYAINKVSPWQYIAPGFSDSLMLRTVILIVNDIFMFLFVHFRTMWIKLLRLRYVPLLLKLQSECLLLSHHFATACTLQITT